MNFRGIWIIGLFTTIQWAGAVLPDEKNNIEVYQKCHTAVVNITATTLRRDFFFDIIPQRGVGSGAIIRGDGYIVTNDHVIGGAQNVEVTLFDKTSIPAKVVGSDPTTDLAVLKINPPAQMNVLEYNLNPLSVGQKVLAIGNPFGLGGSLSVGIISSLGRDIRTPSEGLLKDVIQTDAAINPGNSGGPLLDSSGKLIGINAQIVSKSGGNEGIGFAINGRTVKKIVDQLIQFGKVTRPELGLYGISLDKRVLSYLKIPKDAGLMVTQVAQTGSAAQAGLREATKELIVGFYRIPIDGDVIFQVDDTPVGSLRDLRDYLGEKKVGDTVKIHFYRNQKVKVVSLILKSNQDKKYLDRST
ncbi:PDZ domain-containing protein [bacterium]|nr:PDZ domain-containing protein [bacterium]